MIKKKKKTHCHQHLLIGITNEEFTLLKFSYKTSSSICMQIYEDKTKTNVPLLSRLSNGKSLVQFVNPIF